MQRRLTLELKQSQLDHPQSIQRLTEALNTRKQLKSLVLTWLAGATQLPEAHGKSAWKQKEPGNTSILQVSAIKSMKYIELIAN